MTILIAILLLAAISFAVRIAPLTTPAKWQDHRIIQVLGKQLPAAIMLLLVISSFNISQPALPQLLGIAITAAIHLWRRNILLSMTCGILTYIILMEIV